MGTLRLRIRQALSADKLPPSSGIVVPRVPYMPSFPECPHTVVTMQRLAISRPSGSRLFSTDVTKMARALPNDVSNNDIGNILIKLIDETATPFDIATLFATAPGAVVSVLKIYFDNILQDNPDNTVMNLLHQPRVPADARIALALLYTSAQVDHDALDGELTAAIRESSVAEPSMALSGKQVEVDLHQLTAKIRALFRRFMPEADRILALVDVHQQRHAQDITAMTAPIDIPTLKPIVMGRRSLTPDVSLSLLFHGGELASWFKMLIGRNITRDSQRPQTVMVGLLGNIAFTGNQLGMIIDLIKTSGLLALDIEQIVLPHVRSNPTLAEKLLRSLYVANKPMGEYVLAEYERRYNLPEARVDRAMAAAFSEGKQQRHWRKAATVGAAEMEATVKRALLFADTGDEAQLRVVASRFIGAVIDNFRELRSDLQAFGPEQDPSGYHVFTILNTKTYDSSKNPLGFLLPHELAFWEQGFSNAHPTVEYIRKMMRVVSNGDFRELYSFFLEKRSFDDGMRFIHKAAHGEIPGVDANAVHELMRGAVLNPGQHAALLLWATSEPSQPNKRDAWAGMPLQAVRVLNYAQSRRATIAGNIVELILRSEQYDARAELNAVQYYARTNGNWVHILPIDYSNRRKIADLLVISKDGSMQLVEVKNKLLYNPQSFADLDASMKKAAEQLASSNQSFTVAGRSIYLRLAFNNGRVTHAQSIAHVKANLGKPEFSHVKDVVIEMSSADAGTSDIQRIVITNEAYQQPYRKNNGEPLAGPHEARLLTDRLIALGMLDPFKRNTTLGRLAAAPANAVLRVRLMPTWERILEAIDRYNLRPHVNGNVTAPDPR